MRKDLQDRVHSGNVPKKGQRKDISETEGHSEGHPGQQLPITCLLIICKFLPGIIGEMLNQHMETKGLLVDEHQGSRKEIRGKSVCVDHLFAAGFTLFDKNEYIIQEGLVYR